MLYVICVSALLMSNRGIVQLCCWFMNVLFSVVLLVYCVIDLVCSRLFACVISCYVFDLFQCCIAGCCIALLVSMVYFVSWLMSNRGIVQLCCCFMCFLNVVIACFIVLSLHMCCVLL